MQQHQLNAADVASESVQCCPNPEMPSGAGHQHTIAVRHVLKENEQLHARLREAEAEIADLKRQLSKCTAENRELLESFGAPAKAEDPNPKAEILPRSEPEAPVVTDFLSRTVPTLPSEVGLASRSEASGEEVQPGSSSREPFPAEPRMLQQRSDSVQKLSEHIHKQIAMHRSALEETAPRSMTARGPRRSPYLLTELPCVPASARGEAAVSHSLLVTPRQGNVAPLVQRCSSNPAFETVANEAAATSVSPTGVVAMEQEVARERSSPRLADDRPLNMSMGNASLTGVALTFFDDEDPSLRRARQQRLSRHMEMNRKKQEQVLNARKGNRSEATLGPQIDDGQRIRPGEETGVPRRTPRTSTANVGAGVSPRRLTKTMMRPASPSQAPSPAVFQARTSPRASPQQDLGRPQSPIVVQARPSPRATPQQDPSRPQSPSRSQPQHLHQLRQLRRPQSPGKLQQPQPEQQQQQQQPQQLGRAQAGATSGRAFVPAGGVAAASSPIASSFGATHSTAAAEKRMHLSRSDQQIGASHQAPEAAPQSLHDRFASLREQLKRQRGSVIAEAVEGVGRDVSASRDRLMPRSPLSTAIGLRARGS